jgi:menaquinone-specific isochorismate synthase
MLTSLAFLQTGADAFACVEGPLEPIACPHAGSPAFFAPDFALAADRPWWFDIGRREPQRLSRDEWRARFPLDRTRGTGVRWCGPDETRFARAFQTLKRHLDRGTLRKGVPVAVMMADLSPDDATAVFERALARVADLPPQLLAYGFFVPASAAAPDGPEFMIGATPETLFEIDSRGQLTTMAVAGTRPAVAGPTSLATDPKEIDEHQSVVEDLVAQLGEWGRVHASGTEVRVFGQLEHLVADIRLEADVRLEFEAVARKLHPTPALGVYPRNAAGAEWLAGIDPAGERKRFGAPFGLRLASGGGRCLVAIRNLQYRDGRLELWAGCGIVPQSRYGDEWQEVLDKMRAVRTLWDV